MNRLLVVIGLAVPLAAGSTDHSSIHGEWTAVLTDTSGAQALHFTTALTCGQQQRAERHRSQLQHARAVLPDYLDRHRSAPDDGELQHRQQSAATERSSEQQVDSRNLDAYWLDVRPHGVGQLRDE